LNADDADRADFHGSKAKYQIRVIRVIRVLKRMIVTRLWPQPKLHHKGHKEHKDFSLCALWPLCGEKNLRGRDSFSGVIQ
jgi:hypothetical protein